MYTCWQQYLKKGRTLIEIKKILFNFLFYKKHFWPPFLVVWIIPWNTFEQSKNLSFFFQFCLMFVSLVVVRKMRIKKIVSLPNVNYYFCVANLTYSMYIVQLANWSIATCYVSNLLWGQFMCIRVELFGTFFEFWSVHLTVDQVYF